MLVYIKWCCFRVCLSNSYLIRQYKDIIRPTTVKRKGTKRDNRGICPDYLDMKCEIYVRLAVLSRSAEPA